MPRGIKAVKSKESKIVGQKKVYQLLTLAADHDMPALIVGDTGCLHPDTMIYDPTDKTNLPVHTRAERDKSFHVYALNEKGSVIVAEAEAPRPFTKTAMYRFMFDNGEYLNEITVTGNHRFYIGSGQYATARQLFDVVSTSVEIHLPSISARALSESFADAQHSSQTAVDFPAGYLKLPRLYDPQPQSLANNGLESSPLPIGAPGRNRLSLREDGLADTPEHNRQHPNDALRTKRDSAPLSGSNLDPESQDPTQVGIVSTSPVSPQLEAQLAAYSTPVSTALPRLGSYDRANVSYVSNGDTGQLSCKVVSVTRAEPEVYYDFHVPTYENYWCAGVFNHNTGKTSIVQDIANCRNQTWTRFNLTGDTTVDEFVGKYTLSGGATVWEDGILLQAMKNGHWLIVDEINVALPEILFALHSLLDDDKFVVVAAHDGEIVRPHKDFRFFATMNPVEEYAGTKELNKAFKSRFNIVLEMKYPSKKDEIDIVHQHTGLDKLAIAKMVDLATVIRAAKKADKVFYTCSTRDLIHWAKLTALTDIETGFTVTVLGKAQTDEKMIIHLFDQVIARYNALDSALGEQPLSVDWFEEKLKTINEHESQFEQRVQDGIKAKLQTLV